MADNDWYSDETATLGDRIAGAREALGIDRDELSHRLGVREETLEKWEEDRAEPRANRVQMLAGILGVSLTWLLSGRGDGPEGPAGPDLPQDVIALMDEMRTLQSQIARASAKLAQVEKRLRKRLRDGA